MTGCSEDAPTRAPDRLLDVEGAFVPETAEEGSPIAIEVWGSAPSAEWTLAGFDVRREMDGVVAILPLGRRGSEAGLGNGSFRGTATITALPAGACTIRLRGAARVIDFPIHVFPRHAMLRLVVRDGIAGIHEELAVGAEGWAMAFRRGAAPPVRVELPHEQIEALRARVAAAGFFDLEDRYVGTNPRDGLLYDLAFREPDRAKQVLAEDRLAPESLRALAGDLRHLIDRILSSAPPPAAVTGAVDVTPLAAAAGSARTVRLRLANASAVPETLRFRDGQQYDLAILGPIGIHEGEDPGGGGGHGDGRPHLIWNWAFGLGFTQATTTMILSPGEVRTIEETWSGRDNAGGTVGDGRYRVIGIVPSHPPVPVTPAEILVGDLPPVRLSLTVEPHSAPAGTSRALRLVVANPASDPLTLHFPSAQLYDFHIFDPMSMRPGPIWSWSADKRFAQTESLVTIPAGGQVVYAERWDGRIHGDVLPHPGAYQVRGVLLTNGAPAGATAGLEITR